MSIVIGKISTSPNDLGVNVEWRIQDFFSLSERYYKARYFSPYFSFNSQTWQLSISPNGWSARDSTGHIHVDLVRCSDGPPTRLEISVALKTLKGEKKHETHFSKDFEGFFDSNEFPRFLLRSELWRRQSELVPSGFLTMLWTIKSSTSAGCTSNTAPTSAECCHCNQSFDTQTISCHQRKCMHRPIKCPDCLDIVVLQKWLDEHECQKERIQAGKGLEENSENTCVEACTQTEEENEIKGHKENSENTCVEASTQTEEESEEIKELSSAELNKSDDTSEVAGPYETEASGFNESGITETKEPVSLISLPEKRDLVTDVNDLLNEGRGIDVTFELETSSGKREICSHQLILSLRSPYFADLFYSQGRNKGHQVIPLKGINTKAFEQMIRYCYDYKPCLRTIEDACALFKVAFDFKVISLQNLCHTFFRFTEIGARNVFSVLKISEEMEYKSLKDTCYRILQEKTGEVMATYELCDITPSMVQTILDLPKLSLSSEYELIKWLFAWAKVKSEDKDSSSGNARKYLENLLQNMNFLALTFEEFAMLCKDNHNFFSSDEIANVSLNIAFPGTRQMPIWYDKDLKCRLYTGSKE